MKKIHWFTDKSAIATPEGELYVHDSGVIGQISRVLKLRVGERLVVRTQFAAFEGTLSEISRQRATLVRIEELQPPALKRQVSLLFCIPKKDKFELILEKCTEIGVTDFYPIVSQRTVKTNMNRVRSEKIIEEACEQAQRLDTPILHEIRSLEDAVREMRPAVFDTEGGFLEKGAAAALQHVLIGPEGGFSEDELVFFRDMRLDIYHLGNNVLKTETAAMALASLILFS